MNMDIKEKVESMLDPIQAWREHIWNEHGVRDPGPTIGFLIDGAENYDHAPADVLDDLQEQGGEIQDIIYTVCAFRAQFDGFTRYKEIVGVFDAYGFSGSRSERDAIDGTLEEDFQSNPSTKVTEQIAIVISADDLVGGVESAIALRPYGLDDGGHLTWGEPQIWGPDDPGARIDGRILEVMEWGVAHAHEG